MRKLFGVLCLLGTCCLAYYIVSSEVDTFALIKNGQTAPGFIVETWREVVETDEETNIIIYDHLVKYQYRIPDGREFTEVTTISNKLRRTIANEDIFPHPIEVKYLPAKPSVSCIESEGQSIFGWAVDLAIGLVIPGLLGFLGIFFVFKNKKDERLKDDQKQ